MKKILKISFLILLSYFFIGCSEDENKEFIKKQRLLKESFVNGNNIVCSDSRSYVYIISNKNYYFTNSLVVPKDTSTNLKTFTRYRCDYPISKEILEREKQLEIY